MIRLLLEQLVELLSVLLEILLLRQRLMSFLLVTLHMLLLKQVSFLKLVMRRHKSKHVTLSLNLYLLRLVLVLYSPLAALQNLFLRQMKQQDCLVYLHHLHSLVTHIDSAGSMMPSVLYLLSVVQQSLELMITVMNLYYHLFRKTMVLFLLQQLPMRMTVALIFLLLRVRKTMVVFSIQLSLLLKELIQPVVQHMLLDFLFGLVLVLYSLLVEQRKLLRKQMIPLDSLQSVVLSPYLELTHSMDLEHSTHSVVLQNLELGYTTEIFLIHSHLRIMEVSMLTLHLTKIKVR